MKVEYMKKYNLSKAQLNELDEDIWKSIRFHMWLLIISVFMLGFSIGGLVFAILSGVL